MEVSTNTWYVYMLRCADDSLYTGVTKDLSRRCRQHNDGTASRYTRGRCLLTLGDEEVDARDVAAQSLTVTPEECPKPLDSHGTALRKGRKMIRV